ncbi:hypothetical protein [Micromonospora sp. DT31]
MGEQVVGELPAARRRPSGTLARRDGRAPAVVVASAAAFAVEAQAR